MARYLRFYKGDSVQSVVGPADQASCFIKHGRSLLATGGIENCLIGLDRQNTVRFMHRFENPLSYEAFGYSATTSATLFPAYAGELPDPVMLCYPLGNGYRFYNPVLRRFMSPDNVSPFGRGGTNPYAYTANDPVNNLDTDGHAPVRNPPTLLQMASNAATRFSIQKNLDIRPLLPKSLQPLVPSGLTSLNHTELTTSAALYPDTNQRLLHENFPDIDRSSLKSALDQTSAQDPLYDVSKLSSPTHKTALRTWRSEDSFSPTQPPIHTLVNHVRDTFSYAPEDPPQHQLRTGP